MTPARTPDPAGPPDADDAAVYAAREADWRCGALVYQLMVDRFAPSADLAAKAALYAAPRRLRRWDEPPRSGPWLAAERVWRHEIDFWGGDLASATGRLDHLQSLGVDVVYLNPIHQAWTNHKYDALDYQRLSPEYGTADDFRRLADAVHGRGMKLVLDGVFNHMGRRAPLFREAAADPAGRRRDWFVFGDAYPGGARSWCGAENLPELNLEHPAVREAIYGAADSPVRRWLRDGADGWRLDVAVDIGFRYLDELRAAAHAERPGSLVLGEVACYPAQWLRSLDAVLHFTLRRILLLACSGELDAATAGRMIDRLVADCGIDAMLRSWIYLDNHDTPRLASALPEPRQRRLAQLLQFTLPGSVNLYYGSELGMAGGADPENRAPMRWDLAVDDNPELAWTRSLAALRRRCRALRVGGYRRVTSHRLLAFERHTDRVADSVIVIANPGPIALTETVMPGNSCLMNPFPMHDLLGGAGAPVAVQAGLLTVTVPAYGGLVLQPDTRAVDGYSAYKRVP